MMPNILHVIDTTGPGGAETIFVALATHFSRPPYHSMGMIRGPGWVTSQLDAKGVPFIVEDSRGSVNLAYLKRLIRHVREHHIDLIHAHLPGANLYGSMAGWFVGIPVISTFHGSADIGSRHRLDAVRHWIVRRCSRVVTVSEPLRDEVARRLRLPAGKVQWISNGIDCRRFADAEPLGLRERFDLPEGAVVVGSLGNIRAAKAYEVGLHALRHLRDRGVRAYWFVAGQNRPGDSLLPELEELAEQLGIAPYVRFLGFVEAPERFLADLDVFLLCSSSEGHPLAVTQAMASGKPIVATRCGVEQILDGGSYGWLADVGDASTLAGQIQLAAIPTPEVDRRTKNAQAFALAHYDLESVMESYERIYTELLARAL